MSNLKFFGVLIAALLFSVCSSAQDSKAKSKNLKTVTVYEQKSEKGVMGKSLIESLTRYDQAGNITEEIEYKQGKMDKHFTYKYDAANNKIEEVELDPSGKKIKIIVYTYSNNLRTERVVYDGNKQVLSRKTYKYETY
jgi:hypothetical protein